MNVVVAPVSVMKTCILDTRKPFLGALFGIPTSEGPEYTPSSQKPSWVVVPNTFGEESVVCCSIF